MTVSHSISQTFDPALQTLSSNNVSQPQPQEHAPAASVPDGRQALKTALGNRNDLKTLAQTLNAAMDKLPEGAEPEDVAKALKETLMPIDPESTFRREQNLTRQTVSLETFIKGTNRSMPFSVADVREQAQMLTDQSITHPLGNFAGALSWALPLGKEYQRELFNVVACNSAGLEGLPLQNPRWSALDYLADAVSLSRTDLQDPAKALEKLLDSPRSQALGEAIQNKINGIATDSSVNDYVLAAIHLGLDHESIDHPEQNRVAGFDMAADKFWNKPPTDIVSALAEHLIASGKTSRETAALGARLLLGRVAPQYLVKDIPPAITVSSIAWANLCVAVARIEAQTPGKAASMSFGEVMLAAEDTPPPNDAVQKAVLMDWAVSNQIVNVDPSGAYAPEPIEYARGVFNRQLDVLKAMSEQLETPMPNRKAMASASLTKEFGTDVDFERKCLRINYGPESPGLRFGPLCSMRELTMQGEPLNDSWQLVDGGETINKETFDAFVAFTKNKTKFNVVDNFNKKFTEVTSLYKDIKKNLVMNAITHLPLEDRNLLNHGKLRFFKENSYTVPLIGFEKLFHSDTTIQVQAELNGKMRTYLFDTEKGNVVSTGIHPANHKPVAVSNEVVRVEEFLPDRALRSLKDEVPSHRGSNQNHFENQRIQNVAATVVKGLGIDSDAVRRQAEGRTDSEQLRDTINSIGEFLLNLVPFVSAINSFSRGDIKDGFIDLAFDVFGILTAGVGMVGKLAKVAGRTGNTLAKVAHGSRIVGATAFSAFNPLGGLGDLTVGAGKILVEGASAAGDGIKRLRGMATGSDLVEASKRFESAATGTFKVGENTVEGSAVMQDGRWYAYDAHKQDACGVPQDFQPTHTLMPPSPQADVSHRLQVSTRQNRRHHPYQKTPNINGRTSTTPPTVIKTEHLVPIKGEYVNHIKGLPNEGHFTQSRKHATLDRFDTEMNDYYEKLDPLNPPSRPTIPETKPYESVHDLIEKALDSADVVIFGESHQHLAMFREIDASIEQFKRKNVKVVGIEGVIYRNNGSIKDEGMGRTGPGYRPADDKLNLQTLMAKFEAAGIEVVPLDHPYLTRHWLDRDAYTSQSEAARNVQRLKEFNYYATRTIEQNKHKGKVIALVGRQHINTTQGVTGLAEATGGIGIGVYERAGIRVGYGTNSTDIKPGPMGILNGDNDLAGDLQIFSPEA
ncbi:membrane-targeted effector domain-containing toxin [Pseudomonas sp. MWU15-20650]|uniref:membrane-targeted effector domain-containing toxin n=1 Tax=Pseudomonas sp. MWU15-20650 TaxID=2933107 RepID=UPI00200C97A1|nr:membrane-targeted effector domain-containing toxin [Pseudomonas sp. MWU15-20650]